MRDDTLAAADGIYSEYSQYQDGPSFKLTNKSPNEEEESKLAGHVVNAFYMTMDTNKASLALPPCIGVSGSVTAQLTITNDENANDTDLKEVTVNEPVSDNVVDISTEAILEEDPNNHDLGATNEIKTEHLCENISNSQEVGVFDNQMAPIQCIAGEDKATTPILTDEENVHVSPVEIPVAKDKGLEEQEQQDNAHENMKVEFYDFEDYGDDLILDETEKTSNVENQTNQIDSNSDMECNSVKPTSVDTESKLQQTERNVLIIREASETCNALKIIDNEQPATEVSALSGDLLLDLEQVFDFEIQNTSNEKELSDGIELYKASTYTVEEKGKGFPIDSNIALTAVPDVGLREHANTSSAICNEETSDNGITKECSILLETIHSVEDSTKLEETESTCKTSGDHDLPEPTIKDLLNDDDESELCGKVEVIEEAKGHKNTTLRSALKKDGGSLERKGLRVCFSDSHNEYFEPDPLVVPQPIVPNSTSNLTLFLGGGFELQLADLCHWEAALAEALGEPARFGDGDPWLDNTENEEKAEHPSSNVNGTIEDSVALPVISNQSLSDEPNHQKSDARNEEPTLGAANPRDTKSAENSAASALTEANLRTHEWLLLGTRPASGPGADSSESASSSGSQDTMILMTSEEGQRTPSLKEQAPKSQNPTGKTDPQQEERIHAPTESSSTATAKLSAVNKLGVSRSNSAVRRCLERTALRRSLTRCSEARRRCSPDVIGRRVSYNDASSHSTVNPMPSSLSLEEKLRMLTEEVDRIEGSTGCYEEEPLEGPAEENISHPVEFQSPYGSLPNPALPRLDLDQVKNLLSARSLHELYSSPEEVSVPKDVRQWKLRSSLWEQRRQQVQRHDKNNTKEMNGPKNDKSNSLEINNFGQKDMQDTNQGRKPDLVRAPPVLNLKEAGHQESSKLDISHVEKDLGTDELELFVHQDRDRIERIRRRYGSGESDDPVSVGFCRRPSVRGIRPKFGSTSQILQQLQQQLQPPLLARAGPGSHLTWPYGDQLSQHIYTSSFQSAGHLPSLVEEQVDAVYETVNGRLICYSPSPSNISSNSSSQSIEHRTRANTAAQNGPSNRTYSVGGNYSSFNESSDNRRGAPHFGGNICSSSMGDLRSQTMTGFQHYPLHINHSSTSALQVHDQVSVATNGPTQVMANEAPLDDSRPQMRKRRGREGIANLLPINNRAKLHLQAPPYTAPPTVPPPYVPPPSLPPTKQPLTMMGRSCERGAPEGASSSPQVPSDSVCIKLPADDDDNAQNTAAVRDDLVYFSLDV